VKKEEPPVQEGFNIKSVFKLIGTIFSLLIVVATFPMRIGTFLESFVDLTEGIALFFQNIGYVLQIGVVDVGMFISEFVIPKTICTIEKATVFQDCWIFYLWDLLINTIYLLLIYFPAYYIKMFTGIDLLYIYDMIYDKILMLDDYIFYYSGVNLFRYSKATYKKCYYCKMTQNKPSIQDEVNIFKQDFGKKIPTLLSEPVHLFSNAAKKFTSVFDTNM
jgi:hypothetical protein